MQKKEYGFIDKNLMPSKVYRFPSSSSQSRTHPRHAWTSYQAFDEVSARSLFDWEEVSGSCICEHSHGLCITDAEGNCACTWTELCFSERRKMLPLLSWYKLCTASLCSSLPLYCLLQIRQHRHCRVSKAVCHVLHLYWALIPGIRKPFMWMHGSHSTSLKLKENNRTFSSARQEWCFRYLGGGH